MRHNSETRASKATCAPSCVQSVETIGKHSTMGYITLSVSMQIVLLLIANVLQVLAITTRLEHEVASSRNFRRHIATSPFPEWELGLREAVYQALLRERNLHANLREYLYAAPIIGRQDSASPFGDIAILARGQLYSAPGGFQFVQDPYQNDCDGCHNAPPRCDRVPCENWRPEGHERLLALWTVKRIRHRDAKYGYRYELEYKVSPMDVPVNEPFVTRNGRFDYSIAGHTFIVKADARHYDSNPHHDKVYRSSNTYNTYSSEQWSPNFGPNLDTRHYLPPPPPAPPTEEYYDEDPRKAGYPNVLYGPPELYTQRTPYTRYKTKQPPTYDLKEDERQILRNLIDTLSSKTSTTRQGPLTATSTTLTSAYSSQKPQTAPHFYTMTMSTRTSPQSTAYTLSQLPSQTTNEHSSYPTTYSQSPVLPTIPMQASYGTTQILEETPLTTHAETVPPKPLFTPATIRFPTVSRPTTPLFTTHKAPTTQFSQSTRFVKYSEPDPLFDNTISPTAPTVFRTTKHKSPGSDDFGDLLFGAGDATTVSGKFNTVKFPGDVNIKQPPGEQVIKVVDAPNAKPHGDELHQTTFYYAETPQPTKPSPTRYHVDFNDTQHLQPDGASYITVPLDPSTQVQHHTSPEITLSTASSNRHDFTTQPIVQTRRLTTPQPIPRTTTPTINDNIISATREYTTVSTETPQQDKYGKTTKPTRRTKLPTKTTTPLKPYKIVPSRNAGRKTTKTTREMSSSINTTPSSTSVTSPLISESVTTQSTKTTSLITKETFQSTSTSQSPTKVTTAPPTKTRPTRRRTFSTKPIDTTTKQETTYISTSSLETTTDAMTASTSFAPSPEQTTTSATFSTSFQPSTQATDATTYEDTTTNSPRTTHGLSKLTIKPIRVPRPLTKATDTAATTLPTTPPISRTSTRTTKRTTTPTKKPTTDDFLGGGDDESISRNPTSPRPKIQEQNVNFDLDIFGEPQEGTIKKPAASIPQHKDTANSNEADDIFGSQPENRQPSRDYRYDADFDSEQPTSTTSKLEIIYADFYSPSTATSTEIPTITKDFVDTREGSAEPTNGEVVDSSEDSKNKTRISEPQTSKSYITSVSFEVNKQNETTTTLIDMDEKTNTELKSTIKTTQPPCNTTAKAEAESSKILDALALSVVNHAKSIDYLHSTNDTNNNHDVQSNRNQRQKYKRKRTYRIQKVNTRRRNN